MKAKYKFKLRKFPKDSIDNPTLFQLFKAQGFKCFYCNRTHEEVENLTKDHLFPRKGGYGINGQGNIVIACERCNNKKANIQPSKKNVYRAFEIYKILNAEFVVETRNGKLLVLPLTTNIDVV